LLDTKLQEGNKVINHFEDDTKELVKFISDIGIKYQDFKNKCINVFYGVDTEQSTHELVRQVYFPLGETTSSYHLLSVVTASMLMFDVKNRIDGLTKWAGGQSIRSLKKENKFHAEGFDEIPNLTEIWFGYSSEEDASRFTKMGNVSFLNVRNQKSYLIPSVPPQIQQRQVRLPSQNFFKNSLNPRRFKDEFEPLDKLIRTDRNNKNIREGIRNCLKYIIDLVLQHAFSVREEGVRLYPQGWSNTEHYQNLPLAQRIWLDGMYAEQRQADDEWLEEIAAEFARWILDTYESLFKHSHIRLSDHELREVRLMVKEAISEDKEFFR